MSIMKTEAEAYEKKVSSQLDEAKAVLEGLEAKAKGKVAQAEIDAIKQLRTRREELHRQVRHDLKTVAEVKAMEQIRTRTDADVAKFKTAVDQLASKIKSHETSARA